MTKLNDHSQSFLFIVIKKIKDNYFAIKNTLQESKLNKKAIPICGDSF